MDNEELLRRRAAVECSDYKPLPRSAKCQHYAGDGGCKRSDYFMCVEWVRKNPEAPVPCPVRVEPAVVETSPPPADAVINAGSVVEKAAEVSKPPDGKPQEKLYDLSRIGRTNGSRVMIDKPELLTREDVDELRVLGLEADVQTHDGCALTLVGDYTDEDRAELSFEHARLIVMVMQIFPTATLKSVRKMVKAR